MIGRQVSLGCCGVGHGGAVKAAAVSVECGWAAGTKKARQPKLPRQRCLLEEGLSATARPQSSRTEIVLGGLDRLVDHVVVVGESHGDVALGIEVVMNLDTGG